MPVEDLLDDLDRVGLDCVSLDVSLDRLCCRSLEVSLERPDLINWLRMLVFGTSVSEPLEFL